ncbi:MAG TPA: homocysteine S-methyltransferase family protein [Thermomicrobiales bacterium]|nr:homocysteine S-methyltransferase family protein [Thermomicrobiales bacterium]
MSVTTGRPLAARLAAGRPLLLDAAMGTELDRRGVRTTLPLWSAIGLIGASDVVQQIHVDNLAAGADIITTDTFRTTRRTFAKAGRDPAEGVRLNAVAVQLARAARDEANRPRALIAGSIAPLEDCYSPWLSPAPDVALAQHREQARALAAAGADFLLVETMPLIAEADAALRAARETGLEATIGFVCAPPAESGAPIRLLSGELLAAAVARIEPLEPAAIFVNCAAADVITAALRELRALTALPLGGYANLGRVDDERGWEPDASVPGEAYAASAAPWLAAGAVIVGGCCGTTPEHIEALRASIDRVPK